MHTLTWNHTRTNKPMVLVDKMSIILLTMMRIRTVYPNHPFLLNGKPV